MEVRGVQYVPVDIKAFRQTSKSVSFDVFLKLSEENMAHIFSRSTGVDYSRLAQYIQKGISHLYIKAEDQVEFTRYCQRTPESILKTPGAPEAQKILALMNMTEQNLSEVFAQFEVAEDTAKQTRKVVTGYIDLMKESPDALSTLLKLVQYGSYLYSHSVMTAVIGMWLAKAAGQFNRRTLELLGLGGFLHDIGMTQIDESILNRPDALSEIEWEAVRAHPSVGLKMVEPLRTVPDEAKFIIYQHHEEPSGKGYPNKLPGVSIYYPAKIISVADAFSALVSKRPYRKPYTAQQAMQLIQSQPNKFDKEVVKLLSAIVARGKKQAA